MAEMAKPISAEAAEHVTRAMPRRGRGRPARPARPAAPATAAGEISPAAPLVPMIEWDNAALTIKAVTDGAYVAIGATPPPLKAWVGFVSSWGAVAEYYLPMLAETPVPAALFATGVVVTPFISALVVRWMTPAPAEGEETPATAAA